ncbi:MAG: hypothetical protein ACKVH8_21725 [Pirellulales bacterium]
MKKSWNLLTVALLLFSTIALAQDTTTQRLDAVKKSLTAKKYELAYKFATDEVIRNKVTHLSTVETKIKGSTSNAQSRTISTKHWKVEKVSESGDITFIHSVEHINMWQKVTDRPEQRYDSSQKQEPAPIFAEAAKAVGVPLARITMDRYGKLKAREQLGPGGASETKQVTILLPNHPVVIGTKWYSSNNVSASKPDGSRQLVKTRQLYRLLDVAHGIATITVTPQILTPINDPAVKVDLLQHMSKATVKFDIAKGKILSQQLDQDETIIGFRGEASSMKFLARMTEELLKAETKVATKPKTEATKTE